MTAASITIIAILIIAACFSVSLPFALAGRDPLFTFYLNRGLLFFFFFFFFSLFPFGGALSLPFFPFACVLMLGQSSLTLSGRRDKLRTCRVTRFKEQDARFDLMHEEEKE